MSSVELDNTIDSFSKTISTYQKTYNEISASQPKLSFKMFDKINQIFNGLGYAINIYDVSTSIADVINVHSSINANYELLCENSYILNLIKENAQSVYFYEAATEILNDIEVQKYDYWDLALDAIKEYSQSVTSISISVFIATKCGPYGLVIVLGLNIANLLLGISETCEYAVYTYAMADMCNIIANEITEKINSSDVKTDIYISDDKLKNYLENLRLSRMYAENQYIGFRIASIVNEMIYNDEYNNACNNITLLEDIKFE